ncbi:RHS repeat domain-containing protein, partial [Tepidibacter mesophilus]|uniref:RHS repeat domain-containing protein n=1 Tax=Tepidibacter mesophilus TaxID=655607 RepID=UPI0011AF6B25
MYEKEETVISSVYQDDSKTVFDAVYDKYDGVDFEPTLFTYDKRGLVTNVKDAEGKVEIYEYDGNRNLISVTDKDGYETDYEYDPMNLLKKIDYDNKKQVEFKYNSVGQLVEMKDWNGTNKFDLDPLGRILKVTDFENRVTKYSYSPTGEKQSIIYPDSSEVNYEYDKLGRLT